MPARSAPRRDVGGMAGTNAMLAYENDIALYNAAKASFAKLHTAIIQETGDSGQDDTLLNTSMVYMQFGRVGSQTMHRCLRETKVTNMFSFHDDHSIDYFHMMTTRHLM